MTTETSAVRWAIAAAAGDPVAIAHQDADLRQCQTCGRVGREAIEVSTQYHWVGGRGHELRTYCVQTIACFARRERQEATAHASTQ